MSQVLKYDTTYIQSNECLVLNRTRIDTVAQGTNYRNADF